VDAIVDNLDAYRQGFVATLALTVLSSVLALGTVLAAMRVSPVPTLRGAGAAYVEVVRNTPLTVAFFFVVFVLPQLDIRLSFFVFAVIAVTVYHAAFFCEAVRSGINAVGVGQAEAARSIGPTFIQSLRLVILPQAFRTVVSPLGHRGRLHRGQRRAVAAGPPHPPPLRRCGAAKRRRRGGLRVRAPARSAAPAACRCAGVARAGSRSR
jgi:glutamate transport system permease protein